MHTEIRQSTQNREAGISVATATATTATTKTTKTKTTTVAAATGVGCGRTLVRGQRINGSVMRAKSDRRARRHEYPDTADLVADGEGGKREVGGDSAQSGGIQTNEYFSRLFL